MTARSLPRWREEIRRAGKKLVVTNGCFDLLHVGHVTYLEHARQQGDALLVGINSDSSTRKLKGAGRPLNHQRDRAAVVAALASVDGVFVFRGVDARGFLRSIQPDIYVKGGDYTIDTINQDERRMLEAMGIKIVILRGVGGKSTSRLLKKLKD